MTHKSLKANIQKTGVYRRQISVSPATSFTAVIESFNAVQQGVTKHSCFCLVIWKVVRHPKKEGRKALTQIHDPGQAPGLFISRLNIEKKEKLKTNSLKKQPSSNY